MKHLANVGGWSWRLLFIGLCVATGLLSAPNVSSSNLKPTVAKAAGLNPIQIENSLPGDPTWDDFSTSLTPDLISGYGSKISVNHGDSLDLFVTTTAPSFTIDVYRTGWYNGLGARKITSLGSFPGVHQTMPTPDPITGMVAANWTKTTTLAIPSDWVSGVYLARLTASTGDKSFIFFVVRDDGGHEGILFQTSVTTYEAYNTWGGTSLYNNNTDKSVFSGAHATKVSFDRPFNPGDSSGAGHYFFYEYKFVYWMESQGYDVAYTTDVDTDTNASTLTNHKAFLSVGHDEYWSKGMRDTVQQAINAGVNVAFFGANEMYWQIRFEPNAAGVPDRVEVGYKDFATTTNPPGPDPMWNVNNAIVTTNWRSSPVNLPENAVSGVMFEDQVNQTYPFIVQNATNWVYAGTGFTEGSSIPGIVGYEYDKVFNNGNTPTGLTVLGNSPVNGVSDEDTAAVGGSISNATLYTAPSGARVFAAGTIQWSWGLANIQSNTYTNAGIQQATANILNTFINVQGPSVVLSPTTVNFGTQGINTSNTTQTVAVSNNGTAAVNISNIVLTGTNSNGLAQTNTCPTILAVNASCTITVTFVPTAVGTLNAGLTLTDNAPNSPQTLAITGTGIVPAPLLTLSQTSINFSNQIVNAASTAQTVTLTNTGTDSLNMTGISLAGNNASDFAQTNNCPTTLAVNAFCTMNVTFSPGATGARTGTLTITDNAADSPQTLALSGTGVTPTAYLNDGFESGNLSAWTLPNSDSTGKASVETAVVNTGTNALDLNNSTGQYAYEYTALPGGPQAQTYTRFYFRYSSNISSGTPLAIARNANGSNVWEADLDVNHHGLNIYFWNGVNTVSTVASSANVLSPDTWYSVEIQDTQTSNGHGEVWLNGSSIGTVNGDLSMSNPYARLMLYNSAAGDIYFDDVRVANTYNGTIASSPTVTLPTVTLSPASVDFSIQGVGTSSSTQQVMLTNTSQVSLNMSSIAMSGTNASDFAQTNTCGSSVAPGASCTLNITFTPGATGARSANMTITDNAANSPQTVALTGVGSMPSIALNPGSVDFGSQNVQSSSAVQQVTLTNSGTAPLAISSIAVSGANASDFAQTNTCGSSVAVGASCPISITFTPGAAGARSASITVTDNAASSPQTVALTGTGAVATVTNLARTASVSASSTYEMYGWSLNAVNDGVRTSSSSSMGWTSSANLNSNHTESLQMNFGSSQTFSEVDLYPRSDGINTGYGFPIDFNIAVSNDGNTWTTVVTKTGYTLPTGVQQFAFAAQKAQYVRVTGTNLRSNPNDNRYYRMQFAEIEVLSAAGTTGTVGTPKPAPDLALNKTVYSNNSLENAQWGANRLTDGKETSVSGSNGYTSNGFATPNTYPKMPYVLIDLGSNQTFNTVKLFPRTDTLAVNGGSANFPVNFTIQVIADHTFKNSTVAKVTNQANPQGAAQTYSFPAITGRYVVLIATTLGTPSVGESSVYRMQLAEMEVSFTNLARAATISASSNYEGYGWALNTVNDGIQTSSPSSMGWSSSANLNSNHTEWLQMNFGSSQTLSDVDLYPRSDGSNTGYGFPINFSIAVSNDGNTWTTVVTKTGYALPNGMQQFSFAAQKAQYVRVTGTSLRPIPNDGNAYRMQFAEVTAY
jgi:F5/8 type C domain/Abnormal spindle-like microcephaly-assoc'd, ASPM-SPD-2-Hydin